MIGENMEKISRPIGIFDSGIGGVTVLKEIIKLLPNENYIYYSDSKNNPYGDKQDKEILKICDNIVEKLISRNCKTIVIACNTASAKAASFLREKYNNIPIVNPIVLFFLFSLEFNISSSELFILLFFPVISSSVDISNNSLCYIKNIIIIKQFYYLVVV